MNVHKNARLTPSGRVLLVPRIEAGWSVVGAAAAAGVSARTAHRWLGRYRAGDRHLADRSSRPHHCPHRLAAEQIAAVERLRRQRQTGPAIARLLGMARSSVGLILRRLGLNRPDRLEPRPPVIRYEKARPGEIKALLPEKLVIDTATETVQRFRETWEAQKKNLPLTQKVTTSIDAHASTGPLFSELA